MRLTTPGGGRFLNSLPNFMSDDGSTLTLNRNLSVEETIGPNIVTNGDFVSDLTDWIGANWAWESDGAGGGRARHTAGAVTAISQPTTPGVRMTLYKVTFTVGGLTAGTISLRIGGGPIGDYRADGTYALYRTGMSIDPIEFVPTTDFDGYLSNVSLQIVSNGIIDVGGYITNTELGGPISLQNTLNNSTGHEYALRLDYSVDKATSGNDIGFLINRNDISSPGLSLLLDVQNEGQSQFKVASDGSVSIGTDVIDARYSVLINSAKTVALGIIGNAADYANGIEFGLNGTGDSGGIYWRTTGTPRVNFTTYANAKPMEFGNNWMYMLPTGMIGIGTTTPVGSVHDILSSTKPALFGGDAIGSFTACTFPTATKTKISKTGIGTGMAVGDLVIVTGGTGATVGSYRATVIDSANLITVDRNIHASGTDIIDGTVSTAKDVVGIFATDGVNGSRIANYSHQDKPLQLGGDTLRTTALLTGKDVAIGSHLNLPQVNEAATPTLSFGDGDSGLYEYADDYIRIILNGTVFFTFGSNGILSTYAANGPGFIACNVSSTLPSLLPAVADTDTGIGWLSADVLSLIAGGVEAMRLTETAGVIQAIVPQSNTPATPTIAFGDGDSGIMEYLDDQMHVVINGVDLFAFRSDAFYVNTGYGGILAEVPSSTNPNIISTIIDLDTGLGTAGADILSLIAGGVEAMRLTEVAGVIQAIVPLSNTPATPTIAFGDGDSGFYENQDDVIGITIGPNSQAIWYINSTAMGSLTNGYPSLRYVATTATVPNHLPAQNDTNTGLGSAGADILSLIAGGVEGHRITAVGGLIDHVLTGMVKTPTTQTLTGAGAVDIVSAITHLVTNAANALTLADGAEGQHKFIVMKTDGGDGTLTPTNPGNFATITFNDAGDSVQLLFTNGKWYYMGGTATLA